MDYIAYLHKDRDSDSDFGVSFPDFPGCITAGKTLEDASRKAPQALAFHIAGMLEDGEKIPKPSKIDDLVSDPDRKNAVAFLVTADPAKSKAVRINITARENQIEQIDRLARQAGMTRSAYLYGPFRHLGRNFKAASCCPSSAGEWFRKAQPSCSV